MIRKIKIGNVEIEQTAALAPYGANSAAMLFVKAFTAPFEAA